MKLIADPIEVPDGADWQTIEDAKSKAKWHIVHSKEELMNRTNLDGKCGGCKHFISKAPIMPAYGSCDVPGRAPYRQRTCRGCKMYERRKDV